MTTQGSVILFHGLAANKKIMSFIGARVCAAEGLRVFVPDLPGHGRTQGPFSYERAETCSDSFVRQLIGRGAIDPKRTILAGHSMGGAIAISVASRVPVAGTIAISPAPMVTTYGVPQSMLLFNESAACTAALRWCSAGRLSRAAFATPPQSLLAGENAASGGKLRGHSSLDARGPAFRSRRRRASRSMGGTGAWNSTRAWSFRRDCRWSGRCRASSGFFCWQGRSCARRWAKARFRQRRPEVPAERRDRISSAAGHRCASRCGRRIFRFA